MSDEAATERAIFRRACAVLAELQDDLGWSDVTSKFKGQAKRWQNALDETERQGAHLRASLLDARASPAVPGRLTPAPRALRCAAKFDVGALWTLTMSLVEVIKPTS